MTVPKPASAVEAEIFEFFKESDPVSAYIAGLKEYAGRLFIPSKKNLEKFALRADELLLKAENPSQVKLLDSLLAAYTLQEPHGVAEAVLGAYFGYMIKEGIVPSHMRTLTRNATKAIQVATQESSGKDWPIGLRMLALIRCNGLQEVIRTVRKETQDKPLKEGLEELSDTTRKYASVFRVKGFKEGFDDVYRIIKKQGCEMGRSKIYSRAIARLWDYPETPDQIELKGLRYLDAELPRLRRLTEKLAKKYGVSAKAEEVSKAIKKKRAIKPGEIVRYINDLRNKVLRVVNKTIVRVTPKYNTKVIETPPYLSGIFPSGGAFFYDGFTNNPKEIFMTTTDPRRDPSTAPGEILNLLIHEEYGHCVHASNSSEAYAAKPSVIDMLWSPLGCMSEGISFQRELEFQDVMERLQSRKGLGKEDKALVEFLEKNGGLDTIAEEYAFYTSMWRVVRFLRVIGDMRINTGKQELADFIDWANKRTGLAKSTAYYQLFPAHQGLGPGYASTYAIIGESIREIQRKAIRNGKKLIDLNTYACSMGFPARTIFESRLRSFANN